MGPGKFRELLELELGEGLYPLEGAEVGRIGVLESVGGDKGGRRLEFDAIPPFSWRLCASGHSRLWRSTVHISGLCWYQKMAASQPAGKPELDMETNIKMIKEMGWTASDAQEALTAAGGNIEAAVNWLLTNAPQGVVGQPSKSPEKPKEEPKRSNSRSEGLNIPPPPLDSSDVEDARQLEAMKRNYSTEYVPGHPALQGRPNAGSQEYQHPQTPPAQPTPSSSNGASVGSSAPLSNMDSTGFTATIVRWRHLRAALFTSLQKDDFSPSCFSDFQILTLLLVLQMEKAPKVQVCYNSKDGAVQLKEAEELLKLLHTEHIPALLVDLSANTTEPELLDMFYSTSIQLPQAVLTYQPYGDLNTFFSTLSSLRRRIAERFAEGLQADHTAVMDTYRSQAAETGAVDKVASFVQSVLSNSRTAATPTQETNSYIEFTVMKTNWYLRSQLRRIRFGTAGEFFRFDPNGGELRESVRYDSIKAIKVAKGSISLTIANGTLHSFTAPPLVIDYMFQLFLAYAPEDVVLEFVPNNG